MYHNKDICVNIYNCSPIFSEHPCFTVLCTSTTMVAIMVSTLVDHNQT